MRWVIAGAVTLFCAIAGTAGIGLLNQWLTGYVESDRFRAELEKETAKGLHFPSSHYTAIHRTGFLTAVAARFQADHGRKALRAMDAHGITAAFNPLGIFLRRWQLDEIHIDSGEVGIQTYEPKPEPSPPKPWFHIFLPDRVYLKHVDSEPADITWQLRGQKCGFFDTRLVITPHDRDFNYQATGGTLKMVLLPNLELRDTHLLITKTLLTLYDLDLQSRSDTAGHIHADGTAGTGEDRRVNFTIRFEQLPIAEWLPTNWNDHVAGAAFGNVAWHGKNPKIESSAGEGELRVEHGRIVELELLRKLAALTGHESMERLDLDECSAQVRWAYPKLQIKKILLEEKGKFRLTGDVTVERKSVRGTVELGVAPTYLDWLPKADEIFPRRREGYLWTTVHLFGTTDAPEQDLSPRITEAIKESPGAALKLLFRQVSDWLKRASSDESK
ncbi:MAG: hypothetical protein QOH24_1524 [Verrucomicrobiota bacterium]